MTALSLTSSDLELFLGTPVDTARADQSLSLAMSEASTIVTPVPVAAAGVVLSVAARQYSNPTGVTQELIGPYQASRPSAGIYLTKGERTTLRRLTGGGGAFSIDLLGSGYPDDRFTDDSA